MALVADRPKLTNIMPEVRGGLLILQGAVAFVLLMACVNISALLVARAWSRHRDLAIRKALGASRMALGAERAEILRMVVGRGLLLTGLGTALGLASALALTSYLEKLLYGVRPNDAVTLLGAALLLSAVALLACYIPARRATKIDPIEALRYE